MWYSVDRCRKCEYIVRTERLARAALTVPRALLADCVMRGDDSASCQFYRLQFRVRANCPAFAYLARCAFRSKSLRLIPLYRRQFWDY